MQSILIFFETKSPKTVKFQVLAKFVFYTDAARLNSEKRTLLLQERISDE